MRELLNKVWQSKAGKAAILGGGGVVCAGAVYAEWVPAEAKEVDAAGLGLIGLLVLVASVAAKKIGPAVLAKFGAKGPEAGK